MGLWGQAQSWCENEKLPYFSRPLRFWLRTTLHCMNDWNRLIPALFQLCSLLMNSGKLPLPPFFRTCICDLGSREVKSLLVSKLWVTFQNVTMHSSKTPSEALRKFPWTLSLSAILWMKLGLFASADDLVVTRTEFFPSVKATFNGIVYFSFFQSPLNFNNNVL